MPRRSAPQSANARFNAHLPRPTALKAARHLLLFAAVWSCTKLLSTAVEVHTHLVDTSVPPSTAAATSISVEICPRATPARGRKKAPAPAAPAPPSLPRRSTLCMRRLRDGSSGDGPTPSCGNVVRYGRPPLPPPFPSPRGGRGHGLDGASRPAHWRSPALRANTGPQWIIRMRICRFGTERRQEAQAAAAAQRQQQQQSWQQQRRRSAHERELMRAHKTTDQGDRRV